MLARTIGRATLLLFCTLCRLGDAFSSGISPWASPGKRGQFGIVKVDRKRESFVSSWSITALRHENDGQKSLSADTTAAAWLLRTTETLLQTEPGTLIKGKWHELVSMMTAWSKHKDQPNAPLILESLLKRVIDEYAAGNAECCPTTELYNHVIDAWVAQVSSSDRGRAASRRARQILHLLQKSPEQPLPDAHSFLTVMKAVAQTEKAPVAREMLRWMQELYSTGKNPEAKPTMPIYITVMDAFASSGLEDAGDRAEEVLRQMERSGYTPSTLCYNIAIKAWITSKRGRQSAEHAQGILEDMKSPPDAVTYSSVIHAWAISGMMAHAAEQAERILSRAEQDATVQPDIVVYNSCLNAWCKSKSPLAVNRTEAILARMEASQHVSPDLVSYNTYLHALAMMAKDANMAQRADKLLCRLEERFDEGEIDFFPNTFSYNMVIESWVRSRNAMRACDVLRKLVKRDGVEPDTISFNQVINALARSSLPGAALKAQELLHYMDASYKSGLYNSRVDVVGYTSAITAWSRSRETGGAERAERLLDEMERRYLDGEEHLKPNTIVYNAVIDAWARSGEGLMGARRAESLLQRMQEMYEAGDRRMQPNIITYNAVLNAWARSGTRCCAYKAESYLNRMWELYEAGNKRVKPDGKSYNTVINAISKSKNERKAQKALRILRRMDKLHRAGDKDIRPDELSYTAVLNSCAFPAVLDAKLRRYALDTARFTLAELQGSSYGKPNHLTYGTFFRCCATLLPRDDELRRMVVEPVFLQCCRDGQVGEMVLAHLRDAAPRDLYRKLLKDVARSGTRVTLQDLPWEWRCNVQHQRRWPGRTQTAVKRRGRQVGRQQRLSP